MISIRIGPSAMAPFWLAASLVAVLSSVLLPANADTGAKAPAKAAASAPLKRVTGPVRLTYTYKVGDVRRYKVTGFFTGHFPPFATAGSPPIHLMTVLNYVATVKKVTDKGAEVEFVVNDADLSILEKEPGPDGKVDPNDEAPFPVPLSQVQKMFNATATLKPNGAITAIQGGDTSAVKLDLGIDLRKLFLVTAPIIFADKPVRTGDEWPFDDGLLGSKPGKTIYSGRLQAIAGAGKKIFATVTQQASSTVDSKLDKEGNSTEDAGAVVGSLVGEVKLTGTVRFAGATDAVGAAETQVTDGQMSMVATLKRTLPDPDKPDAKQVTDIDITARLFVKPVSAAPKSAGNSKAALSDTAAPSTAVSRAAKRSKTP